MPVRVIVPTPLRRFADQRSSIECEAVTVGDALRQLTTSYGELKKHLYTDDGRIRSFVNVYLNDEDIRFLKQEQTQIKDGDTITIVPSIAGGAEDAGLRFIV
jgi:adenylyltransferase/sulfurtransferase